MFTHLIAVISILATGAYADNLSEPGTVLKPLAWTEFTFYSGTDAYEALGTMSPEGPKDPTEPDFSGFGDVKCVNAKGDDGIGNIVVEYPGVKGVDDYYCIVQWDKSDCSGVPIWMDDHMHEEFQWTRVFQFDTERLAMSVNVTTGKCPPEIRNML